MPHSRYFHWLKNSLILILARFLTYLTDAFLPRKQHQILSWGSFHGLELSSVIALSVPLCGWGLSLPFLQIPLFQTALFRTALMQPNNKTQTSPHARSHCVNPLICYFTDQKRAPQLITEFNSLDQLSNVFGKKKTIAKVKWFSCVI